MLPRNTVEMSRHYEIHYTSQPLDFYIPRSILLNIEYFTLQIAQNESNQQRFANEKFFKDIDNLNASKLVFFFNLLFGCFKLFCFDFSVSIWSEIKLARI